MKILRKIITRLLCYEIYVSLVTGYSHNTFFFLISEAKSKNNLRGYVAF